MGFSKSLVLTASLPAASSDIEVFSRALDVLQAKGYSTVEFLADFDKCHLFAEPIKNRNFDSVFLAGSFQKKNRLSLCSAQEKERLHALSETQRCIEAGLKAGCRTFLISSGLNPEPGDLSKAWDSLERSIDDIYACYPDIVLTIEPGDTEVDAMQLCGHTADAVRLAQSVRKKHSEFYITMDTSHLAQLGENPFEAMELAKPYCRHIHLANCVLIKGHSLYGDKHPFFAS